MRLNTPGMPYPDSCRVDTQAPDLTDGEVSMSVKSSLIAPFLRHCTLGSFIPIKAPALQSLDLSGGDHPFLELNNLLKVLRGMHTLASLHLRRRPTEPDDAAFKPKPVHLASPNRGSTATQALRYFSAIIPSTGATLIADMHPLVSLSRQHVVAKAVMASMNSRLDTLILRPAYDDPDNISFDHAGFSSLPYDLTLTNQLNRTALNLNLRIARRYGSRWSTMAKGDLMFASF